MADRYLHPKVVDLVNTIGRRSTSYTEDRIRRDGRRFYKDSKKVRLTQLLKQELVKRESSPCIDTKRKLTNLASAEASRKKKQYIQEKSFQAIRRKSIIEITLAKAICVLVSANERQRKENIRISALLANSIHDDDCSAIHSEIDISNDIHFPLDNSQRFYAQRMEVFLSDEKDAVVEESTVPISDRVHCSNEDLELVIETELEEKSQPGAHLVVESVNDFSSVSSDTFLEMN